MGYASDSRGGLNYFACRYGSSRVTFRGPRKSCEGDYVALLGGTETYGRFVPVPFAETLEQRLGRSCVNFGVVNAGLDVYLTDPSILGLASGASDCVVQVMGAQNMSNRFYSVHPRRNDRFVKASEMLMALYPELDFTEFAFNRAMLTALRDMSADRFRLVISELQTAWVARMKMLLGQLSDRVTLLWVADKAPPDQIDASMCLEGEALFVTRDMLDMLGPRAARTLVYAPGEAAQAAGTDGMVFSEFDAVAAGRLPGVEAHKEIAAELARVLAPESELVEKV